MSIPDLTPPWTRIPLVHDTTDLFDPETQDALDLRYSAGGAIIPDASTTTKGVVELATDAETVTGTDTTRATTPAGVAAAIAATSPSVVGDVPFVAATACAVSSYMPTIAQTNATTTVTMSQTVVLAFRFTPSVDITADRAAVYVSTAAAGNMRLGLYADLDGTGRLPGALIADWGTIATGGVSGTAKEWTISQVFEAGTIYWIAYNAEGGSPVMRSVNPALMPRLNGGSQADALTPPATHAAEKSGTGALPNPWGATAFSTATSILSVALRRSA